MIQYFKVVNDDTGETASVYRLGDDGKGFLCEKYDDLDKEWVFYPDVVGSVTGVGRDMDLIPIDEIEAREFVEKMMSVDITHQKKKK
jgi:hypothetical protein